MLIERIVRRTLGIKAHVVNRVVGDEEGWVIELDLWKRRRLPCGTCGYRHRVRDRLPARPGKERDWKHVPLWGIPTTVRYRPARVRCEKCAKIRVEEIPWAQGKCRLSKGLIGLVATWTKLPAWDVAAEPVVSCFTENWTFRRLRKHAIKALTAHERAEFASAVLHLVSPPPVKAVERLVSTDHRQMR